MSKLSFRARALDASRPMAVFLGEELPDLPDHSAISRAVPAMPTGMEKDEECEHHLQRAICAGLIIPTPEVSDMSDVAAYDRLYPPDYNKPRQLIHMQPLGLEQEVPDYDMDSEDERWLRRQHAASGGRASELTELKFEETMERLERGSGQTVVTLREARALAGRAGPADHVLAAVYDYWLNKRLATQQPLLLAVRTEPRPGAPQASPYLAFRRRTEKMQTRKNRKNDESSYEKMVKLRRELLQVVSLLDLVRQRERLKREGVRLTSAVVEKRFTARDFGGSMIAEAKAARVSVVPSLMMSSYVSSHHRPALDSSSRQRDKRQYKRRKHRHHSSLAQSHAFHHGGISGSSSSSEAEGNENGIIPPIESSGPFTFRRKPGCQYHMPTSIDSSDKVPWIFESHKENAHPGKRDLKYRYALASINHPRPKCVGFVRRRMGRGGRVILDRLGVSPRDDRLWESLGYTITDSQELRTSTESPTASCHTPFGQSASNAALDSLIINNKSETSSPFTYSKPDLSLDLTSNMFDVVKVKQDSDLCMEYSQDQPENFLSNQNKISSDFTDITIKREMDESEYSDSEKLSRLGVLHGGPIRSDISNAGCVDETSDSDSLSSCDEHNIYNSKFSFKGNTLDKGRAFKRYRDRNTRIRNSRRTASNIYREDMKVMAELLVARRLGHYEQRVPDMSSQSVDNFLKEVWGDRLHFKPKSPDENILPIKQAEPEEELEQVTEHSPITVHVRLALPDFQQPPSDLLSDSSPFVTSEFSLADIYGDSIIDPNPENEIPIGDEHTSRTPVNSFREISWNQTNGPSKFMDNTCHSNPIIGRGTPMDTFNISESVISKNNNFKGELSENSNSNLTSVFLSFEGGPPSTNSVNSDTLAFCATEDSNHETTNGVISEWNESVETEKIKNILKIAGNGLATKCKPTVNSIEVGSLGSSAFVKVEPLLNNQKIYLDCDKPASPSFSSLSILPNNQQPRLSNQTTLVSVSPDKVEQKKIEVQNQNLAIVQLKTPAILPQSVKQVKQVLKSVLTGDGTDSRTPLVVTQTTRQNSSPVQKVDSMKLRAIDEILPNSGPQQQQLVTLSVPETIKIRFPSHILSNSSGTTNTSDILGLVHHKSLSTNSLPKDGMANTTRRTVVQMGGGTGRPVRVLAASSLSPSQRSKLIRPGPVHFLQLQMRTPHKRTDIESAPQPVEAVSAGTASLAAGGEAGSSTGPPPAAGAPSGNGKPQPPPSPRKSQASLPMEVT